MTAPAPTYRLVDGRLPHKTRTGFCRIWSRGYLAYNDSWIRILPVNGLREPNAMKTYDIGIVGAGVVGCAIAQRTGRPSLAAPTPYHHGGTTREDGGGDSGRNSGVLHSGIHEHPGSLKARFAREGSALAVAYAARQNIPSSAAAWSSPFRGRISVEVSGVNCPCSDGCG